MTSAPAPAVPVAPKGTPVDTKRVVRTILMVFGAFGAVIIAFVFAVIWIFTVKLENGWLLGAILVAAVMLLVIPVIVFSTSANWAFASTPEGAKVLSRAVWWMSALQLVSLAGVIALGIATRPPLWVVITLVACGVVFAPVGIVLGKVLRSAPIEVEVVALEEWTPPRAGSRDPVRWVTGGVFLIIVVLGLLVTRPWTFSHLGSRELGFAFVGLCFVFTFAAIGAMIVCLVRVTTTASALRTVVSRNYSQARRIRRAIYGGRTSELLPIDLERARATASLSVPQLGWFIAFESFLFASLTLGQLSLLFAGSLLGAWTGGAILVIGVVFVVLLATRIAAVRRYLATQQTAVPTAAL